ncbi:unnamed protein product [Penicillium discolor]
MRVLLVPRRPPERGRGDQRGGFDVRQLGRTPQRPQHLQRRGVLLGATQDPGQGDAHERELLHADGRSTADRGVSRERGRIGAHHACMSGQIAAGRGFLTRRVEDPDRLLRLARPVRDPPRGGHGASAREGVPRKKSLPGALGLGEHSRGLREPAGGGEAVGEMSDGAGRELPIAGLPRLARRRREVLDREVRRFAIAQRGPPQQMVERHPTAVHPVVRGIQQRADLRTGRGHLDGRLREQQADDEQDGGFGLPRRAIQEGLGPSTQLPGDAMVPEDVAGSGPHEEQVRIIRVVAQESRRRPLHVDGRGADHETQPVPQEDGPGTGPIPGAPRVRHGGDRIRVLESTSGPVVHRGETHRIRPREIGAPTRERGVPAVRGALRAVEPVEEQPEPNAGLQEVGGVVPPRHLSGGVGSELRAGRPLEDEVREGGRQRVQDVLTDVRAEEGRGRRRRARRQGATDEDQPHRDGPASGLVAHRGRIEPTGRRSRQTPDLVRRESEGVHADEGSRVHEAVAGQGDLDQGRPHQEEPQPVRRLVCQQPEETIAPRLPGTVGIVDDEVRRVLGVLERRADLPVGAHRILDVPRHDERPASALGRERQGVQDAGGQQRGIVVGCTQREPGDVVAR